MKRVLIIFSLVLFLGGCAEHRQRQGWPVDGHLYTPQEPGTRPPAAPMAKPQVLPLEKPIVRVISGREYTSVEEALRESGVVREEDLGLRTMIDELALQDVPLIEMAATLSEMIGFNITVTRAAAEERISVYLQNIPLRQALESICRLNDLWYREDERIVTLMTSEEYAREMVIRRNEKSRAYWLRYTNANDVARVLQATMSTKVIFNDIGEEKVYGYVDEEKEEGEGELDLDAEDRGIVLDDADRGNRVSSVGDRQRGRGGSSGGGAVQGFDMEELKALIRRGQVQQDALADARQLGRILEKDVPAVVTVFKRNNAILARSLDETILQDIGRIIELMDTPTSQVLLEISILQLNLGDDFESFFNLDFYGTRQNAYPDAIRNQDGSLATPSTRVIPYFEEAAAATLGSAAGLTENTFNVLLGNRNINARLELYAQDNRLQSIATPYLMSANNSKVEFFVGQEVPLRRDVESETLFDTDGNVTLTTFNVTVNREELGTDLEISSFINEDGTITMDLEAEISSPQFNVTEITVINPSGGGFVSFPLDGKETSEITSIITTSSGETIALGGIIREQLSEFEKKVPLLGDIPGLGFFFKEVQDSRQKTETIIMLTPHIITHPRLVGQASSNFLRQQSSHPRIVREQQRLLGYPAYKEQGREDEQDSGGAFGEDEQRQETVVQPLEVE